MGNSFELIDKEKEFLNRTPILWTVILVTIIKWDFMKLIISKWNLMKLKFL